MSMHPTSIEPVPEETARVAWAAFRKGNPVMRIRDEIGVLFEDRMFAGLYDPRGQQAITPGRLALVTLLQFLENLSDRQAADAVRGRIDWKYGLSLDLGDPGFDFSVLSEFRVRLIAQGQEQRLLEVMLERLHERGLVKARGKQRTDATHVLAAIRTLNRLELLGETMRAALTAVAGSMPAWLAAHSRPDWAQRYGARVESYRHPKSAAAREALAEAIGVDGHELLAAVFAPTTPVWLRELPAVERLRVIWIQQFYHDQGRVRLRPPAEQPPASRRLHSPYDPEACYGAKRGSGWLGYKVHLTETCEAAAPNLITDVQTTPATTPDVAMTAVVQNALAGRGLVPEEHLVDTGYVDASGLVASAAEHGIALVGPAMLDTSSHARSADGFDVGAFTIRWTERRAQCPHGQTSERWSQTRDDRGNPIVRIYFAPATCAPCPSRSICTRSKTGARLLTVHPRLEHEALQARRAEQNTEAWKKRYACRAGIEGTLSQGVRCFGLRRCRYLGLAKTHLQHVLTAAAMNLARLDAWFQGRPRAQTRKSKLATIIPAAT
ncbi:MAG TPA: IS1182 family transposase [Acetobacteraceae bacterium]